AAVDMEARDHGTTVDTSAGERARFRAYGTQLIEAHDELRDMLDDLREGIVPERELAAHCLAFCSAVTRHHTAEDRTLFPVLAGRHPELREFLAELERDHQIVAGMLARLVEQPSAEELNGIAAVLETHFIGEEKRLAGVLNALAAPELEGWDGRS
ncbi:MAG: hemerythrin domain-containing protein, partial [Actinoplanes sp.]